MTDAQRPRTEAGPIWPVVDRRTARDNLIAYLDLGEDYQFGGLLGTLEQAIEAEASLAAPAELVQAVREWSEAADRAAAEPHDEIWDHREFVAVQRMRRLIGEPNMARFYDDEPDWYAALEGAPRSPEPTVYLGDEGPSDVLNAVALVPNQEEMAIAASARTGRTGRER